MILSVVLTFLKFVEKFDAKNLRIFKEMNVVI